MTPSILYSNPPSRPASPSRTNSHSSIPDDEYLSFSTSPGHIASYPGSSGAQTPEMWGPSGSATLDSEQALEIVLDTDNLVMRGQGSDMEPAMLSGNVELNLTSSMNLKDITMQLTCKAKVQFNDPTGGKNHHYSHIILSHDWSFLQGDKKHTHTLKAGHHSFPFTYMLDGKLPASLTTQNHDATIIYKLRATAIRSGLASNLHTAKTFTVNRTFTQDALEFNQTLEIENTWPGKIMYAITLPFKAYAAGDDIPVLIKFMPLAKGCRVTSITTEINETASIHSKHSSRPSQRKMTTIRHDLSSGKPELILEEPSHPPFGWRGQTISSSRPSRPTSPVPAASTDEEVAQNLQRGDDEVSAFLFVSIPAWATPSHTVHPVLISHKIKWSCSISNADGHVSELRCALPIIILDNALLAEAHAAGATTRNLLFGRAEEDAPIQLPSYHNHVYDRIAVAESSSSYAQRSGVSSLSITPPVSRPSSRPASPVPEEEEDDGETRSRRELSLRDDQELLRSLGALASTNTSPRDTPGTSRGASRPGSRQNSRPPSPDRERASSISSSEQSRHHGFKLHLPAFKPLSKHSNHPILRNFSSSSLSSSGDAMRRTSSSGSVDQQRHVHGAHSAPGGHTPLINGHAQHHANGHGHTDPHPHPHPVHAPGRQGTRVSFANCAAGHDRPNLAPRHSTTPDDESPNPISQVPSYAIASRGFLGGGVVPLDQGLPTYDASERSTANSRRNSLSGAGGLVRPVSDTALVNLGEAGRDD